MKFKFEGIEYRLAFAHAVIGKKSVLGRLAEKIAEAQAHTTDMVTKGELLGIAAWARNLDHGSKRQRRVTSCQIKCGDAVVYFGVSKHNPTDVYSKNEGRLHSLEASLATANREFRTAAWVAYLGRGMKTAATISKGE